VLAVDWLINGFLMATRKLSIIYLCIRCGVKKHLLDYQLNSSAEYNFVSSSVV